MSVVSAAASCCIAAEKSVSRVGLGSVAVEDLGGGEPGLFARRPGLRLPLGGRGTEAREHGARGRHVLLVPDAVRVRHRLAPVREGEAGVRLLRLAERGGGVVELEAVEELHPAKEGGLRGLVAGVGKDDDAELFLRRGAGGDSEEQRGNERADVA